MKIYKFFKTPHSHDAEFYKDRDVADHINQGGHRERLFRSLADLTYVLDIDPTVKSVVDFGCGNGGFLKELAGRRDTKAWGYDLSPKAVEFAKAEYKVDARLVDFTSEPVEYGDVAVLTETLEHLVDPDAMLKRLIANNVKWGIFSVPANETPQQHYEHHLWAFEPEAFGFVIQKVGWKVVAHYIVSLVGTQHVIALNEAACTH